MTLPEKARMLYPDDCCCDTFSRDLRNGVIELLRKAFCEGVEWKDQKFKEYLETKMTEIVSRLEDMSEEDTRHFVLYQRYVYLREIINELYGKDN